MSQGGANNVSGSGADPIETLTGNMGGPVAPDGAFNIDVIGDNASGIEVVGVPASNLLNIYGLSSTEIQIGTLRLATAFETITGTSISIAVHPAGLDAKLGTQTNNGLIYGLGGGGSALGALSAAVDGQIAIGSTGNPPVLALPTSSDSSITITGGAGTLDLIVGGSTATSYATDSGSAVPAAGILTVAGGTGITTSGAASTVTINLDSPVSLANGGTNASLVADDGGIFYSTATAGAILASTSTANQPLLSGASGMPGWSTATYPGATTINQILYSSAANTVDQLATANQGVLTTGATGIPVITAVANDGELIIGSTAGVPAASTLTAGANITITNAGNSITIDIDSTVVTSTEASTDNALARYSGTGGTTLQNSTVIVTDAGEMTNGSQPAFLAYLGTQDSNVTGNGTTYVLGQGNALTAVYDQNSDFDVGGSGGSGQATYTAPITGRHLFEWQLGTRSNTGATSEQLRLVTSNGNYQCISLPNERTSSTAAGFRGASSFADMDAADTAYVIYESTGVGADTAGIAGTQAETRFSGALVC